MNQDPRRRGELFLSAARAFRQIQWEPAVDAYRSPRGWVLKYELAGVSPGDIDVAISGRTIVVRGSRRDVQIDAGQQSYFMEISYSQFQRSLDLPCELDQMAVATDYHDGMLIVRLTCKDEP